MPDSRISQNWSSVCLSLQMAKLFGKVQRADVLGEAGLFNGKTKHLSQGEGLNLENSGGFSRGVYQNNSTSAFSKLQFGQGTELIVKNNYVLER